MKVWQLGSIDRKILWPSWIVRLRQWFFTIIFLIGLVGVATYLNRLWQGGKRTSELSLPIMTPKRGVASTANIIVSIDTVDYNYSKMVALMSDYSRLVTTHLVDSLGKKSYNEQIEKLLAALLKERESYCEFLGAERGRSTLFETRRSKRASLHYLRSMENAIANLRSMLRKGQPI